MIKKAVILSISFLCFSCLNLTSKSLADDGKIILGLKFFKGFPGNEIKIHKGNVTDFISDLREADEVSPMKFMKQYRIIVEYEDNPSDTIRTNGTIFILKNNYFQSEENLIQKIDIK